MPKYSQVRPPIPAGIKTLIRVESGNQCSICGTTSPLEFHHIDENRENNTEENIILLCKNCHGKFHKKEISTEEIVYAKLNTKNRLLDRNKRFYVNLICKVTDFLYLENWNVINQMIGTDHCVTIPILNNFECIAKEIRHIHFPTDGFYQDIYESLLNISQKISDLISFFISKKYANQIGYLHDKYYLDRSWKGLRFYSPDEFKKRNLLDIEWEKGLALEYMALCKAIHNFQESIWNVLDFEYMDRVYIKSNFHYYLYHE